jgi:carboxypeptidase PM20D1
MVKKTLLGIVAVSILLIGILLFNTFRFTSKQLATDTEPSPELSQASLKHFQEAISYKTISYGDSTLFDSTQFLGFSGFLEKTYPSIHTKLSREIVADYSLLYKWEGKNSDLKPFVLMAHQDVVPIEEVTRSMWTVDPFAGEVKEGFIWGRGTTDDKINLISIFEATEKLLLEGYQPDRTIYFAFGHDEEVGGTGAKAIAALLKSRNVKADLVLDEGGIITLDKVPNMTKPIALLGTSEKGYLSLDLTVEKSGGHSSQPAKETAIDILAAALLNIRDNPFEANIAESTQGFLDYIGPEMPFLQKVIFANQWLFEGLIIGIYEKSPTGNAVMRTTAVPTIIDAGIKDNVVPTVAKATVNFRLLPGDEINEVIEQVKLKVNDERVKISNANSFLAEASAVTPTNSFAFKKINETIQKTSANTLVAPLLLIGGTDSRHFGEVSTGIIKFSPMVDPIGFHGIDERVSLESYRTALWFYEQLLRNAD